MSARFTICDLRQRPEFFDAVADRIWRAWWQPHGHPLAAVCDRLRQNLDDTPMPLALVAHDGATFLGTASLISNDLPEREHLTPWVAAVWVDPGHRGRGIGAAVVARAAAACFALRIGRAYLCARPERDSFYAGLGWTAIEHGVGPRQLTVFFKDAETCAAQPFAARKIDNPKPVR
jgi:GNAT superfamily N-acetyltransferase